MNNIGRRIMVIGSPGSGKSTFSRKLSEITRIPLIHLDKEFWNDGWVETQK
jgi:adenylate kinase family enzyme